MERKPVIILNFGSQYVQLIARRVRELGVYSEIVPYYESLEKILRREPYAIILSGGPASVYMPKAPLPDEGIYNLSIPILGICYGLQALAFQLGGKVERAEKQEYGRARIEVLKEDALFEGLPKGFEVWMSHADKVSELPPDFYVLARSENSPYAVVRHKEKPIYGVQFHPEVAHTQYGREILKNFVFKVAKAEINWKMENFVEEKIEEIKGQVKGKKVICALSGGVDSTVASFLTYKAVGDQLLGVFVDHGLLRKGEAQEVEGYFKQMGIPFKRVDAGELFLDRLKDEEDPEEKRRIIGHTFIEVFEKEAREFGAQVLLQGTLYPDVVESAGIEGAKVIKTHHNVGGLPERMSLELLEPLRELFKDEVREIGRLLGVPDQILRRHPFPGPGLAIRILGKVNEEDLEILREADAIFIEELKRFGLYDKVWQAFAVLLPVKSVGVMGDVRTYERVIGLRAVDSTDGMTADWSRLPYEFLDHVMRRIINEVKGINRVVYDISSKPPATIEWE
ncbi:glutamine-hydrolyzing GMP synthase [Thermocrinis sp.]